MRNRFKQSRICSSKNYIQSKKTHMEYLNSSHEEFIKIETTIQIKIPYIKVFGKLTPITKEEAGRLNTVHIIWM